MYDTQCAAQVTNYPQGAALGQQLGGINSASAKPLIADAMLQELSLLIEKASMIRDRQSNLKIRIFGATPTNSCGEEKCQPSPQGFLGEANYKLTILSVIMDGIIQNCTDLERLA